MQIMPSYDSLPTKYLFLHGTDINPVRYDLLHLPVRSIALSSAALARGKVLSLIKEHNCFARGN